VFGSLQITADLRDASLTTHFKESHLPGRRRPAAQHVGITLELLENSAYLVGSPLVHQKRCRIVQGDLEVCQPFRDIDRSNALAVMKRRHGHNGLDPLPRPEATIDQTVKLRAYAGLNPGTKSPERGRYAIACRRRAVEFACDQRSIRSVKRSQPACAR
jgi:hypothetical protein